MVDRTPHLTWLLLSKRPGNAMRKLAALSRCWPDNAWAGTTIGHPRSLPLLKPLLRIPAPKRFLSNEPLLAPVVPGLDLTGIDWCIAGGESPSSFHPKARPCHPDWVRALRDLCVDRGVAFFMKQWGHRANNPTPWDEEFDPKAKGGATLDGRLWREWP
jgi:protein gp37